MRACIQSMLYLIVLFGLSACAILQGDDKVKKAQVFMAEFQNTLARGDEDMMKLFQSPQSRETIFSAIDILQNNDTAFVKCRADYSSMKIEPAEEYISEMAKANVMKVSLTATFIPVTASDKEPQTAELVLWLLEKDNSFVITTIEGDKFYQTFTSLKHDIQYAEHIADEIKKRSEIYAIAQKLEEKYDSVVWYARYDNKTYFYVITGEWNQGYLYAGSNIEKPVYQMGLVDQDDKLIIPVAFDLIGTIGSEVENAVEVKGPAGYGYFSLSGDTLVQPTYEQIIPYPQGEGWIVRTEGLLGWIGNNKKFSENLPNKAVDEYVRDFSFIPSGITINESNYSLCETPDQEHAGSGAFIAPSYWVNLGISEPVRFGLATTATEAPIGGWTEYSEMSQSLFEKISDQVNLLVVHFKERYLEGRSEFYETNKVVFADNSVGTLVSDGEIYGSDFQIKKLNDGLLELKSTIRYSDMMDGGETQYSSYKYFGIVDGGIEKRESARNYPQTQFAYLDSTYLEGTYSLWNEETQSIQTFYFTPVDQLRTMRNEILRAYGLEVENGIPRQYTREEMANLSDNDFYNLNFLTRMIQLSEPPEGDI